jgi:hypothetical protein
VNYLGGSTGRAWVGLLLLLTAATLSAASNDYCAVCGDPLAGAIYRATRRGRDAKVFVCGTCAKLETTCYICSLPVKNKYTRLADGRLLCEEDAKSAVLTQDDADKIFDDVKRELQSTLAQLGSLPHHNIHFVLEAKARLNKSGSNLISAHDDSELLGLTRSTVNNGKFQHTIYALYGLTRERLMIVAAHEYGHTWLHENVHRKLNQDAVEGFCDWMAYKIISRKSSEETRVLLESDYSRGQMQAFIAAEKDHRFYDVMNWVKNGADPEVDAEHPERILVLRDRSGAPAANPLFGSLPITPRANPTNLVLKGLSGSATRRFALINDATFLANEQGKVRLGESNVVVRCLEIRNDSVVIQVAGESDAQTLTLNVAH